MKKLISAGIVVVIGLLAWWLWPSSKLPADFGLDNPPVEVCYAEGVVVVCATPVETNEGK